jgi:hypothetical protein
MSVITRPLLIAKVQAPRGLLKQSIRVPSNVIEVSLPGKGMSSRCCNYIAKASS